MDEIRGVVTNSQPARLWKNVTGAVALAPYENRVKVTAAAADYDITLPPMGEMEGRGNVLIKRMIAAAGGFGPTVKSKEIDAGGPIYTSGELSALNDFLLLWTDGERWYELAEATT